MKILNKFCPNNCNNQYYLNTNIETTNMFKYKHLIVDSPKYPIPLVIVTHLPKLNFIEYLCSIGGFISMWFGYSLFHLTVKFISGLKKFLQFMPDYILSYFCVN